MTPALVGGGQFCLEEASLTEVSNLKYSCSSAISTLEGIESELRLQTLSIDNAWLFLHFLHFRVLDWSILWEHMDNLFTVHGAVFILGLQCAIGSQQSAGLSVCSLQSFFDFPSPIC